MLNIFKTNKKILFAGFLFLLLAGSLSAQTILGDANQDGSINIIDALAIARYYVGLETGNINLQAADVDANGLINIVDSLIISQYYVGLITQFPGQSNPKGADLLLNGDFSDRRNHWESKFLKPCDGRPIVENGELRMLIAATGDSIWQIQLRYPALTIVNGHNYRIRFDARAESGRTIEVAIGPEDNYAAKYYSNSSVLLTTGMQTFSFNFTMAGTTDTAARLEFNGGLDATDFFLDNIQLTDLSAASPTPTPYVTAAPQITPGARGSFPYASHFSYSYGLPSVAANQYEENYFVYQEWLAWKSMFVTANGAGGNLRVQRPDQNNDTVSEGIGYGMLLAVYFDDRTTFNGLWNYAKSHMTNSLMDWQIDASGKVIGANAAIDADEDMALALVFADKKWGGYRNDATSLIDAIWNQEIEHPSNVVKPGNKWGGSGCTNISYFAVADFKIFAQYTGNSGWNSVVDKSYSIINAAKNPSTNLVPDWCDANGGSVASQIYWDPHPDGYYYDAVRTPWRIGLDYLWFGDARARDYCQGLSAFFNIEGALRLFPGYYLNGTPIKHYIDGGFIGTAGAGMMASSYRPLAEDTYLELKASRMDVYFQDSLRLFGLLAMTGNMPNLYEVLP